MQFEQLFFDCPVCLATFQAYVGGFHFILRHLDTTTDTIVTELHFYAYDFMKSEGLGFDPLHTIKNNMKCSSCSKNKQLEDFI